MQPKNNGDDPPKLPEIKRPETVKTPQPEKSPQDTKKKGKKGGDDNN
jgi:hypothetical protein